MNFASIPYLIFTAVVFFVYWHLSRRQQNLFLLAASYFFYANWDWRFLGLIIISTLVNFYCGGRIHRAARSGEKKFWLVLSLAISLGILGYFKYFNFFADSLAALAQSIGWHLSSSTLDILLPVGISFYTFQSLSYSIDIYRGRLRPTGSLIDFAAFVSFFPQLVAGPIVRASEFIFQLEKRRTFSGEDLQAGLVRFLMGFFKKTFVADTLAVYLVDPVFADPGGYSSGTLWLALVGYSVQIYADFSGYSNMAIGSARILGFRIPENFAFPYLARNISEFWRRWHMTMSRFFRDYVYIALGGNRLGGARTLVNLAVTTLISGLWHGAGWTFVIWGGVHGLYIATYHFWRTRRGRLGREGGVTGIPGIISGWVVTQLAVCVAWVLFRSQDFGSSLVYLGGLVKSAGTGTVDVPVLIWLAFGAFAVDHFSGWIRENRPEIGAGIPSYVHAFAYTAMIIFLYHARLEVPNPFIYFQF
jgi:alginate O-acetyltransferase complex protein AlgI